MMYCGARPVLGMKDGRSNKMAGYVELIEIEASLSFCQKDVGIEST